MEMKKEIKVVKNEKRVAIVNALENANEPMTLADISKVVGFDVKTGTTNPMVEADIIRKVGTVKVPVVTYREVAVYAIGEKKMEA